MIGHRIVLVLLASILVSGSGACGDRNRSGDGSSSGSGPAEGVGVRSGISPGDTVEVIMDDYLFGMPSTLPSGEITFDVSNVGLEEHEFMLTRTLGDSAVWQLPRRLAPGESMIVTVRLEPGSYQAVCEFAGHVGRGMIMDVSVN